MTPEEALALIDKVCAQVSLPRQGHVQLASAIQTLKDDQKANKKQESEA